MKRRILIPVTVVVVVVLVLVALLPMMISGGLGHGLVRSAIGNQINGTADFQQLRVSWLGPQAITGLRLVDDTGDEAAVLDVSVDQGLLPLIFGGRALDVAIAGIVRSDWYENGTLSLQRLVPDQPEPDRDEPFSLQGIPAITITVAGITAFLNDVAANQEIIVEDMSGYFVYVPGTDLSFDLRGATESGALRGSISASGGAPGLFDRSGRFTPEGAPLNVQLAVSSIPVPGVDVRSVLHNLTLNLQSQNLAQLVSMNMQGQGTIDDEQPSRFMGEFRVRNPIKQDGTLDIALERIEGQMTGERVPSSLLQPAFNGTPIVLSRDIGRTVNLDLQLNPGPEGVTVIRAVGERATVELSALEREGWWRGDNLVLRTDQIHPTLVEGLTGLIVEQGTDMEIVLTSFAIPPFDEQLDGRPWGLAGATGSLRINGPINVIMPQESPEDSEEPQLAPIRFTLSDASLSIDAVELGDAVYLTGSMLLDGGEVTLDYTVTNLVDPQGRIEAVNAQPIGTLTIANMPTTLAAQLLPGQADMIDELLGQSVNATVRTDLVEDGLQAQLEASGRAVQANFTAVRTAHALRLIDGRAQLTVTPALAQSLLVDMMDEPVQLTQAATATFELAPTELPFDYQWRGVPLTGVLTADNIELVNVPGTEEALAVEIFRATIDAQLDEQWSYGVNGRMRLMRAAVNRRVARVEYAVNAVPRDGQPMLLDGTISLTNIIVNHAEAVMGHTPGTFENWIGQSGALQAQVRTVDDRYEATLTSQLERLTGTFVATLVDDLLTIDTDDANVNLGAAALASMLAPEDGPGMVEVLDDVPFRLVMQSRMPLSLFTADPYDPQLVNINAELTGGPLAIASDGERSTLSDVTMLVRSEPVGESVDFVISIDATIAESPSTAQAGEIDVQGRVRELMTPEVMFNFDTAIIDLDASAVRAPSVLADAMLNMRGYFVSVVGPEMNATITTRNFSRESGTLSMDVSTVHGWLRAAGEGSNGLLVFAEGSPVEGELELTPLLRSRLLGSLHPLLGDIVAMAQPMHLLVSDASLPLDGDISRMNGEIVLTLGEVDFNARSPMFAMLRVARVADVNQLDGFIEPIRAHVRDGVISYDQFIVTIDQLRIPYQGQIDLNSGSINLRTTLPLGELLVSGIREVPEEARMINVPLVTRGSFADFSTEIDPQFDLGRAMLEAGVQRGLEELIPRDRLPFDLRDILPRR